MPDETLHDLMVQVGLVRARPRPLPQSMRPAWETTPEATQPYALPRRALDDPNTVPYERRPTQQQIQQDRELERFARMHELNRNDVNTPPGTYFGQDTLEMTGAPALSRGMDALAAGDPGRALPEVAIGGASILGWGFGAHPTSRAPMRPPLRAMEPAPRLPLTLADEWDGPLYHGTTRAFDDFNANASQHEDHIGAYVTPRAEIANDYASGRNGALAEGGNVRPLEVRRGNYITPRDFSQRVEQYIRQNNIQVSLGGDEYPRIRAEVIRQLESEGYLGVRDNPLDEVHVFNPARDTRSIFSRPQRPSPQEAPRLPNAPARLPGRATDGSVLPIRPPEPIRQSMVGGSDDLAEAAAMRPAPPRISEAPDAGSSGARQVLEGEVILPNRAVAPVGQQGGSVPSVVGALEPMIPEMRAAQADIRRVLGDEEYFAPRQPIDVDALEPNRRAIARASVALEEFVAQNRALRAEQAARALPDGNVGREELLARVGQPRATNAPDGGASGAGQRGDAGQNADEFTHGPLYHGTRARFDNFDVARTGENRLNFVADREIADRWAGNRMDRARGRDPQGRVIEAYARLRNPQIIEGDGSVQPDGLPYDQIEAARAAGHDGVILRNFDDAGEGVSDYTIVFDQNNVRIGPRSRAPNAGTPRTPPRPRPPRRNQ